MNRIRIGVVGLGWVATHRHLPALRLSSKFEVVGIADRNGAKAEYWAKRLGIRHHTCADSIDGIPWMSEVDAIDIATAPMSHFALIRDALLQGKHVITEKPFAMSVIEGEHLVALAHAGARVLAIVHNFQFARSMERLLRDIQVGQLGALRSVSAMQWGNPGRRLPEWYEDLPGGLFYDESPHLLYLLRRLVPGPLRLRHVDCRSSTTGLRTPAAIDASFEASGPCKGVPITLSCRFEAPLSEWHITVLGDRGAGLIDVFRDIYIRLPNDGRHEARQVLLTSFKATWQHWARHFVNGPLHLSGRLLYGNSSVFQRFGNSVLEGHSPEGISAQDALEILRLQHAILAHVEPALEDPIAQPDET